MISNEHPQSLSAASYFKTARMHHTYAAKFALKGKFSRQFLLHFFFPFSIVFFCHAVKFSPHLATNEHSWQT